MPKPIEVEHILFHKEDGVMVIEGSACQVTIMLRPSQLRLLARQLVEAALPISITSPPIKRLNGKPSAGALSMTSKTSAMDATQSLVNGKVAVSR